LEETKKLEDKEFETKANNKNKQEVVEVIVAGVVSS
jgi:hypothetical protein